MTVIHIGFGGGGHGTAMVEIEIEIEKGLFTEHILYTQHALQKARERCTMHLPKLA